MVFDNNKKELKDLRAEIKREKQLLSLQRKRKELRSLRFNRTAGGKIVKGLGRVSDNVLANIKDFQKSKRLPKRIAVKKKRRVARIRSQRVIDNFSPFDLV